MIDALSRGTGDVADIPPSRFAAIDIEGSWGEGYQLKYCKDVWHSSKGQAITYADRFNTFNSKRIKNGDHPLSIEEYLRLKRIDESTDINLPIYQAQTRLIPSDQLPDAISSLNKRIDYYTRNPDTDNARLLLSYKDTLQKLTDHVESPNGAKSLPSIVSAISHLVKEGRITEEQLQDIVHKGGEGAAQGFLQGATTALIKNSCRLGYFGADLQRLALEQNPEFNNVVVIMVTTAIETIKDVIRLHNDEIEATAFAQRLEKRLFIASFGHICGTGTQGVLPYAPPSSDRRACR